MIIFKQITYSEITNCTSEPPNPALPVSQLIHPHEAQGGSDSIPLQLPSTALRQHPTQIKCPKRKGLSGVSHGSTSTALPSIATESHGKSFVFLQDDFGAANLWLRGADNADPPSTDRTFHCRHLHGPTDLSTQGAWQHSHVPFTAMLCPSTLHQSPRAPAQSTLPAMETYFSCHISQVDQTDSHKL